MERVTRFAVALLLGGFVLVGCDEAKDKTQQAADKAKDAAGSAAAAVTDTAAETLDALKKKADTLLAEARQFITEKKLDNASSIIEQLKALKSKLPAEYQSKVDEVVKLFDAAKLTAPLGGK